MPARNNSRFDNASKQDKVDPRRGVIVITSSGATSSKTSTPNKDKTLLVEDQFGADWFTYAKEVQVNEESYVDSWLRPVIRSWFMITKIFQC